MRTPLIRRAAVLAAGAALAVTALAAPTPAAAHSDAHFGGPAKSPVSALAAMLDSVHHKNIDGKNWGGYAAQGTGFTSVSGSWKQVDAKCNSSNDLYAPWVGIDGYGSTTVEQTGVATDCSSGSPVNEPWYEMYPAAPVYLDKSKYPVAAGDTIKASVTNTGGNNYKLDLSDSTKGWTFTVTKAVDAQKKSAEAIIESPPGAYPNFGTVTFTDVTVNGKPIGNANPVALDPSSNGTKEATASALSGGNSFSMKYDHE